MSAVHALSGEVAHLAICRSDGRLLLASARGHGVEIRTVPAGEIVATVGAGITPHSVAALPVAGTAHPAPAGDILLVGGSDGVVRAYAPATGEQLFERSVGESEVQDMVVLDGGDTVACARGRGVVLWRPGSGEVTELPGPTGAGASRPYKLSAYELGGARWLVCAYTDDSLVVWNLSDPGAGPASRVMKAHSGQIWSLIAFEEHGSGPVVASGSADGTVRIWRPRPDGRLEPRRTYATGATVRRLGHTRDGRVSLIVTATADGDVSLWRLDGPTDRPMTGVTAHEGEAWSLACAVSADTGIVIASGGQHGTLAIDVLYSQALVESSVRVLAHAEGTIWTSAVGGTPEGAFVAYAGVDRRVYVIDPSDVRDRMVLREHTSTIRSLVAGGADEPTLVSGGADARVLDWDLDTGELRRELRLGHRGEVWALALLRTADGVTHVVSGSADGSVRTCPVGSGGPTRVLATDIGAVHALLAITDGERVAVVASSSRGVRVIGWGDNEPPRVISRRAGTVACAIVDGGRELVVTARLEDDASVVEVADPWTATIVATFRHTQSDVPVSALAAGRIGDNLLIFGGRDDGRVLVWQLDGRLIGTHGAAGPAIRSLSLLTAGVDPRVPGPVLISAGDDGAVRQWPITVGALLHSGGALAEGANVASILLTDQPTFADRLSRSDLVDTMHDALVSPKTRLPIVIGVHAPWGQGKSSILRQLRRRLDPRGAGAELAETPRMAATHRLTPPDGARRVGRLRSWWQGGEVRTRISRSWAWRQIQKSAGATGRLPYEMRPTGGDDAITVWFNPWMYERPEQMWAGLTREILTSVTNRLDARQRERLWFDLNLRRTDPTAMRRRILSSYIPQTLPYILGGLLVLVGVVVAVVSTVTAALSQADLTRLLGPMMVGLVAVFGVLVPLAAKTFQKVRGWVPAGVLSGPTPGGLSGGAAPGRANWAGAPDPLQSSASGYLYLLQHDVREVVHLAARSSKLVLFIDDLDRCTPPVVAETVEAINLFINDAFGPCALVIALDPATVAAQLETTYGSIRQRAQEDPISFGQLRHTGWRFMEKVIDLPIRLPRVSDPVITGYLDQLLDGVDEAHARPAAATPGPVARPRRLVRQRPAPGGRVGGPGSPPPPAVVPPPATGPGSGTAGTAVAAPGTGAGSDSEELTRAGIRLAERMEDLQPVRLALQAAVLSLPGRNPRQTKAFINLWRFYMVLEYRTRFLRSSLEAVGRHSIEIARFVELVVRWPWLLDVLGSRHTDSAGSRRLIEELVECRDDDERWADTARAALLDPEDSSVQGLRNLLRRTPGELDTFSSIAYRYL
ncbi:P-loop NTPase fold protein [Longispora sp. K20-0274]|uniref:P-loop NTPase fold protein n=1 Tax=Longispora sp. K20-0274 TaxID=3088255 RepID=UPI00399BD5AE